MKIQTFVVPYDSGQRDTRMGAGPLRLFSGVVQPMLERSSLSASAQIIEPTQKFRAEIATAFDLNRLLAEGVGAAVQRREFPLILSGNCNATLGATAGLGIAPLGVIWFDAHGDFNTPETTTSGFFDGLGLATVAGLCWRNLSASIPGFSVIPGERILHIGARDVSQSEADNMAAVGAQMFAADDLQSEAGNSRLVAALDGLRAQTANVYVHLDLDVVDRAELCANEFSPPGGLPLTVIARLLGQVTESFKVCGVTIASYDPAEDRAGRGEEVVRQLLEPLLSRLCLE